MHLAYLSNWQKPRDDDGDDDDDADEDGDDAVNPDNKGYTDPLIGEGDGEAEDEIL